MRAPGKRSLSSSVTAITCAVALAACGASYEASSGTGSGAGSPALKFADCIRARGVPSFPDPTAGGGGFNLGPGIHPQSPAFKTARQACAKLTPRGRSGGVQATESQFLAALRFAKCMRGHGFPRFPDPTRFDSPPGPILILGHNLFFRVSPSFDPTSPPVKGAVAACGGS